MRKNMKAAGLALVLLLLGFALPAGAIEFGAEGQCSNLQFPWNQTTALGAQFSEKNYFWGGSAFLGFPFGEDSAIRLSYERDPVLRNVATMGVEFERGIAKISVGPFFGFLNSTAEPFNAGLSTAIRFQWPGVAYASVRSDGAIAIGLVAGASAEPQARAELAAGFYTRNAIVSALISASQFSMKSGGYTLTDSLARYMLTVDLFKKNVPYTLMAEVGYQLRSKDYGRSAVAAEDTDVLGSLVLGLSTSVDAVPGTRITAGLESAVFSFGSQALQGHSPSSEVFLFTAKLGVSFDTESLPKPKPKPKTAAAATAEPGSAASAQGAGAQAQTTSPSPSSATAP